MLTIMTLPFFGRETERCFLAQNVIIVVHVKRIIWNISREKCMLLLNILKTIIFLFVDLFMRRSDEKENIFFKFNLF